MAKVLLDSGETFDPNSGSFSLIGSTGSETVLVREGVAVTTDGSIERIEFTRASTEYTYKAISTGVQVLFNGSAIASVQAGQNLVFADGSAPVLGTFNATTGVTTYTLGGQTVLAAGSGLTPALSTAPGETSSIAISGAATPLDLTTGVDRLTGTAGDDTFTADIFDNGNSLQSGDRLDGGAGTDTLNAEVGNSQNFAISAKTTSVENIFIQAQATNLEDWADNFNSGTRSPLGDQGFDFNYSGASWDGYTQIDAGEMQGVRQLWSDDSRANLVIEDVSVNSHLTTIGMRDTDPGDVNFEVYFDPQNITAPGSSESGAALFLRLLDLEGMQDNGLPLENNPYNGFSFTLGGARVVVQPTGSELLIGNGTATFQSVVDAINSELHRSVADGGLGLTQLTARLGNTYTAAHSTTGSLFTGTEIVIDNFGEGALAEGSWLTPTGEAPAFTNVLAQQFKEPPVIIDQLTQVDVVLDNVARIDASGSGDLVIGDMSESGIQQFNVEVQHSSHIDQLASTNNVLEVVNVVNGSVARVASSNPVAEAIADEGNLIINQLDDVRVFDASAMTGDVDLTAFLSADVTAKYMDLLDTDAPAADNVAFAYTTGTGDDSVELTIDKANLAAAGTTSREDFNLNITTGAGNDEVTLQVGDNSGDTPLGSGLDSSHWYQNSKLNANLRINTNDGNDTINAFGAGDRIINAGADADTVYIDNSGAYPITGRKAIWVLNTTDQVFNNSIDGAREIDDQNGPLGSVGGGLLSDDNDGDYRLFNVAVRVSFQGFEGQVTIATVNGEANDLQINNAIKEAINSDAELSKLLLATDGPANTLVISSLIDGEMDLSDLTIGFVAPTTLSPAELQTLANDYGVATTDVLAEITAGIADVVSSTDYLPAFAETSFGADYEGVNSFWVGDNHIEGNTGDDVIVLGTGSDSNDTLVYNGYNNGLDTVVNFQIGWQEVLVNTPIVDVSVGTYTQGSAAAAAVTTNVAETFVVEFTNATATNTVTYDTDHSNSVTAGDVTVNVTAGMTAVQVRDLFVTAATAGAFTISANADGTATFTETAPAGVNLVNSDVSDFLVNGATFTATPTNTGVVTAVVNTQDGAVTVVTPATVNQTETFTLSFSNAIDFNLANPQYISFDGEQIPVLPLELGTDIAAAVGTGIYTNWTVTGVAGNTVTFASVTANTNVTDAVNFADDSAIPDAFTVPTEQSEILLTFDNVDYIDFSEYLGAGFDQVDLADAVYNDFTLANDRVTVLNNPALGTDGLFTAADLATTTIALDQIFMVESNAALQDGRYTIYHAEHTLSTSASAVTLTVIGTVDFGAEINPVI